MSDESPPPSSRDLDARLRAAKARHSGKTGADDELSRGSGLAFAVRIGVEMVSALAVGVGIGLLLDRWLGTGPWFLLLFFVLGAAAGMLNVYRAMAGYGYSAGYHRPEPPPEHGADERDRNGPE